MEQITDIYIESCNNYLDEVGQYIQVFTFWDDVNTQNGWMISPDTYRKMIKPKQRRLVEAIKKKTDAKLFFHGCGATFDLIPDLIDLGFDILNPVQVSAAGMDTQRLKRTYGQDITFWGGGVDTQHVLPFGLRRRWSMKSSAASTTWLPAAASSLPQFTTSRPTSRRKTSWRCSIPRWNMEYTGMVSS